MKKLLVIVLVTTCSTIFLSCTDAFKQQINSLGNDGKITCWSGGKVIYSGESTGKIQTEASSDGWYFRENGTGMLVRLSGDCVIRN